MIFILLILLALTVIGLRRADGQEACLKKEHTDAIKGIFIIIVFYSHILPYLYVIECLSITLLFAFLIKPILITIKRK